MTGLELDETAHHRRQDDDSWRPTLMHAMWGVIVLVGGWLATDFATTRKSLIDEVNSNTQRIAILEEANRNTRDALQRIESGVQELRQQRERTR